MFGPVTVVKTRSGNEVERPRPAALLPRPDELPLPPDRLPEPPPRPDNVGLDVCVAFDWILMLFDACLPWSMS